MKRAAFLGSVAFGVAPLVLGAQGLPLIRVATPAQESAKTVYYGVQSGIFRRAGVNVELLTITSGAAGLAALAGGSVEVAYTSMLPLIQGHARGLPFEIVAPGQLYLSSAPTQALFVRRTSSITHGSDVNGKVVAVVTIRDMNWAGTRAWIDMTGGDSSTVKFVELPPAATIQALMEGRIDVATVTSPYTDQAMASSELRMLGRYLDAVGKRFEVAVFVGNKPSVDASRDAFSRFARAMHDSARLANENSPAIIDLIANFTHVDRALVAKGMRTIDPEYVDERDLRPVLDLCSRYKLVDRALTADELIASTALRPPTR